MTQPTHPQRLSIRLALALLLVITFSAPRMMPAYAASLVVNGNADTVANDGVCTLREAILNANNDNQSGSTDCAAGSGADTITFAANYTITLGSQLPTVTTTMTITGNGAANTIVQASASPNTVAYRVFAVDTTGNLVLNGLTVQNGCNSGCLSGGGVYNGGAMTISSVVFKANYATYGGGLHNSSSNPTLTNVTFSGNWGSNGGGMNNFNSSPTLTNVTFSGNSASIGGGMRNEAGSSPTLANVTFSCNAVTDRGGGIFNDGSHPTLGNVTFSGNSAASNGGGVYNYSSSHPILKNTLIANSVSGGACVNSASSSVDTASANNLIDDAANACGLTNGINGNIIGQDPRLDALADSGGSTQTFALLPGSPAIDAGDNATCLTTDQRGVSRPQGVRCDIGAFELVANPVPTITTTNPTSAAVNANTLTLTITGTNFVSTSSAQWFNGSVTTTLATTFVNSTQLTALVPKALFSAAGPIRVTVSTPPPGGGTSNSANFTIIPTNAAVAVWLTSTCNPCLLYQTVGLTATVTNTVTTASPPRGTARPRDAVPTGTITFQDDGNNITGCGSVALNSVGQAVCNTILPGGTHTIRAYYTGDTNFNTADGTLTQFVNYLVLLPDVQKHP